MLSQDPYLGGDTPCVAPLVMHAVCCAHHLCHGHAPCHTHCVLHPLLPVLCVAPVTCVVVVHLVACAMCCTPCCARHASRPSPGLWSCTSSRMPCVAPF